MNSVLNKKFIDNIDAILIRMKMEATRRNAPIIEVEEKIGKNPFNMLVFTMLSARTRDSKTIEVVEKLFKIANTPKKISKLPIPKLERILYGIGFYRIKARNLKKMCRMLETGHQNGQIPDNLEELLELPGVGRKTANIILARSFGKNTLGVDVHVHRLSNRLGIIKTKKPEDTEEKLLAIIPIKQIRNLNFTFVAFGQTVCQPRRPLCLECPIYGFCKRVGI